LADLGLGLSSSRYDLLFKPVICFTFLTMYTKACTTSAAPTTTTATVMAVLRLLFGTTAAAAAQ
jgi:hypothetical protein